jgi:hypothetical protein
MGRQRNSPSSSSRTKRVYGNGRQRYAVNRAR